MIAILAYYQLDIIISHLIVSLDVEHAIPFASKEKMTMENMCFCIGLKLKFERLNKNNVNRYTPLT